MIFFPCPLPARRIVTLRTLVDLPAVGRRHRRHLILLFRRRCRIVILPFQSADTAPPFLRCRHRQRQFSNQIDHACFTAQSCRRPIRLVT
jgi:CTP:molybdopterin cytidylyltransferase MocA